MRLRERTTSVRWLRIRWLRNVAVIGGVTSDLLLKPAAENEQCDRGRSTGDAAQGERSPDADTGRSRADEDAAP